jgi:hypothetical protein
MMTKEKTKGSGRERQRGHLVRYLHELQLSKIALSEVLIVVLHKVI